MHHSKGVTPMARLVLLRYPPFWACPAYFPPDLDSPTVRGARKNFTAFSLALSVSLASVCETQPRATSQVAGHFLPCLHVLDVVTLVCRRRVNVTHPPNDNDFYSAHHFRP